MPHMMPMMWMLMFTASLLFLFLLSTMIYFFYIPTIQPKKPLMKLYKWKWMW